MNSANTRRGEGQAGGKIILLGEHAVVHGSKALSLGLSRGVRATALLRQGPLTLEIPAWNRTVRAGDGSREGEALEQIALSLSTEPSNVEMEADVQIPIRAGLGSSAALAGAVARALRALRGLPVDSNALFEAVQASEKVFHGNPSGLDARTSLLGGLLIFSRTEGFETLALPPPGIAVFYSGHPGDTAKTVAQFAGRLKEKEGREHFARMSKLAVLGALALKQGDLPTLGALMYENHDHLDWFGVSSPSLNRIVALARQNGALGAKLTGGGGGGCAIVLVDPAHPGSLEGIRNEGYEEVVL